MQSTTTTLDPSTRLALANLRAHLTSEGDFSPKAIGDIIEHVRSEGTLFDAPFLYPSEVDRLTEVYVRSFSAVSYDDPAWWADTTPLPPMSGGCDEDIPPSYEPTLADWADYHAAMDAADYLAGFNAARDDASEVPA